MRALLLALLAIGCSAGTARHEPTRTGGATRGSAATSSADPAPHWHAYPEIPPDNLSRREAGDGGDGGDDATCSLAVTPPPLVPDTRVRSGPPVTNRIPPELVMAPIRTRAECFRRCYERGLQRDRGLEGRVVVEFVIDRDGWVRKARVRDSELSDDSVSQCVAESFVGLSYPEPPDRVTVVYPLSFEPEPRDAGTGAR